MLLQATNCSRLRRSLGLNGTSFLCLIRLAPPLRRAAVFPTLLPDGFTVMSTPPLFSIAAYEPVSGNITLTFHLKFRIIVKLYRGVAQLVARLVRVQEAVGSTPATPTKKRQVFLDLSFLFWNTLPSIDT